MVGFLIAVLSGVLMSVQGIFNTQVTKASSIWSANVFVQATALLSCLAVWLAADRSNLFAVFRSEPKYLLLGGVLGAGITWTVIKAMAMLGPARAVLFIVVAQIAAAIGRSASPVAGVTIICAKMAGVSPMDVVKRSILPMLAAVLIFMFMLM